MVKLLLSSLDETSHTPNALQYLVTEEENRTALMVMLRNSSVNMPVSINVKLFLKGRIFRCPPHTQLKIAMCVSLKNRKSNTQIYCSIWWNSVSNAVIKFWIASHCSPIVRVLFSGIADFALCLIFFGEHFAVFLSTFSLTGRHSKLHKRIEFLW